MLGVVQLTARAESAGAFDYGFEAIEGGGLPMAQRRGKALVAIEAALARL